MSQKYIIQKKLHQTQTPIFAFHSFLKNFAGINFRESSILKNFAGINFRESTFLGVKKGIYFREFGQNSRNFLPAKISSLKVHPSFIEEHEIQYPMFYSYSNQSPKFLQWEILIKRSFVSDEKLSVMKNVYVQNENKKYCPSKYWLFGVNSPTSSLRYEFFKFQIQIWSFLLAWDNFALSPTFEI